MLILFKEPDADAISMFYDHFSSGDDEDEMDEFAVIAICEYTSVAFEILNWIARSYIPSAEYQFGISDCSDAAILIKKSEWKKKIVSDGWAKATLLSRDDILNEVEVDETEAFDYHSQEWDDASIAVRIDYLISADVEDLSSAIASKIPDAVCAHLIRETIENTIYH